MIVYDAARKPVTLGPEISRGGEGTVYPVYPLAANSGLIAKLYARPPQDYADKLAWMALHPPNDPGLVAGASSGTTHASIAWPLNLLYNPPGQFAGYVMPRVTNAAALLSVFNPRTRARTLPNFNWQYQHRTARNLAKALKALHDSHYVVGDLNESNVLVTPTALITIIDTDSFQVHAHGRMFYCPVGKPEYTPPELQGKTFRDEPRKPEHDSFGLSVLVFQLLMDGSHPFRAQWFGAGDPPSIEERIRQGLYPYADIARSPVAPPPNTQPLSVLHPGVVALFDRCFIDGHNDPSRRPTAGEWDDALADAEKALIECPGKHIYSKHLRSCPHCDAPNPEPLMIPGMKINAGKARRLQKRWQSMRDRSRNNPAEDAEGARLPPMSSFHLPQILLPKMKMPEIPQSVTAGVRGAMNAVRRVRPPAWVSWVIVAFLAWLLGAHQVDPLSARVSDPLLRLAIATVYGSLIGAAQALIVRTRMREAGWWGLLTALAVTAGVITDRAFGIRLPGSSTILLMAAAQAALLYSRTPGILSLTWLPVNALTWLLAIVLPMRLPASISQAAHVPLSAMIFGLCTGLLISLFARGQGHYAGAPLLLRLRVLGIGWRDVVSMLALLLLIVALVGFILQPCNPMGSMLKLGVCIP